MALFKETLDCKAPNDAFMSRYGCSDITELLYH